jgi:APA family basic amino acid/polyamine antiporter
VIVNVGVLVLRRTKPDLERGFRVPAAWLCCTIGIALCVYLMLDLERDTWIRFVVWLALGLVIYAVYGRRHSRLRRGDVAHAEAEL